MLTLVPACLRKFALLIALATPIITACGGSDSTPTPPAVAGTLAVVVTPAAVSVVPGASGASAATITRGGSFTGDVALSSEGAPAGVTVSFGSPTLGAGVTSSTVSVAVAASYTSTVPVAIAIKAAGTGVTTAAATLTLTVTAAAIPTLAVSVAPAPVAVVSGASGSTTAMIVRGGGFAGVVTLASTVVQGGITVALTPPTIPADSTTRTIGIAVAGSVPAGSYPISISATGTGVAASPAVFNVTVTAPVVGSSVTLSYCAADAPIWVAYQDGSGPWTRVSATGTNSYTFSISSGKAGIATVDTVGTGYDLNVTYATTAEMNGFGTTLALGACGTKTVNGSVANVSNAQFANITLGYSSKFVLPIASSAFTLTDVASGPQDLFAARLTAATQRVDKIILRRGIDIANGGSLAVLDFNAAEAFAPATANVTISGLGADTAVVATLFNGLRGSTFGILGTFADYVGSSGAVPFDAVPAAQLASGELQQLYAIADAAGSSTSTRFSGVYFRAPTNQAIAFGPELAAPTVTRDASGAYSRTRVVLGAQAEYNRFLTASYSQSSANRAASVTATQNYLGSSTWDLTLPNLSGVTGWTNTWGLLNGTGIDWNVSASGGALHQLDSSIADGTVFRTAQRSSASPLP
ncbi:MAG: hypothetical protein H7099_00900 [Gemmatimonadaceae bacterium]|nr:hypothetical protein [Gemmatimonadaceae bacterium]